MRGEDGEEEVRSDIDIDAVIAALARDGIEVLPSIDAGYAHHGAMSLLTRADCMLAKRCSSRPVAARSAPRRWADLPRASSSCTSLRTSASIALKRADRPGSESHIRRVSCAPSSIVSSGLSRRLYRGAPDPGHVKDVELLHGSMERDDSTKDMSGRERRTVTTGCDSSSGPA